MRSIELSAAVLLWTACAPALAQGRDLDQTVEQLEAENAVLRIELRALRERLEALEAIIDARAPAAGRPHPWPEPAANAPDTVPASVGRLTADTRNLLLADVRLADDAGADTPEALAELLVASLQDPALDPGEALARLSAFDPGRGHAFLIPATVWQGLQLRDAPVEPSFGALRATWTGLGPWLRDARIGSLQRQPVIQAVPVTPHGFLGITVDDERQVTGVQEGMPASGELAVGDRLSWIRVPSGRVELDGPRVLIDTLREVPPHTRIVLGIERSGQPLELTLRLVAAPAEAEPELREVEALQRLSLVLQSSAGRVEVEGLAARIQGRWLLVESRSESFGGHARAVLEALYAVAHGGVPQLDDALIAKLEAAGVVGVELAGRQRLRLPLYTVELETLPNGEWGAWARPLTPAYPTLLIGPLPGRHDPLKNPYRVRELE